MGYALYYICNAPSLTRIVSVRVCWVDCTWLSRGRGYWTVIIFRVRCIVLPHWLWSFYLFLL